MGVFARYSYYDYAKVDVAKVKGGEYDEFAVGMNYWPTDNVVLKADFSQSEKKGGDNTETYNFGVGYSF